MKHIFLKTLLITSLLIPSLTFADKPHRERKRIRMTLFYGPSPVGCKTKELFKSYLKSETKEALSLIDNNSCVHLISFNGCQYEFVRSYKESVSNEYYFPVSLTEIKLFCPEFPNRSVNLFLSSKLLWRLTEYE